MSKNNFLDETRTAIHESNRKTSDVLFIGSADGKYRVSWDQFKKIADFEYDDGFGSQKIAKDLIVCFKDGNFLERWEYDGSEGWTVLEKKNFSELDDYEEFTTVIGEDDDARWWWRTLYELNN